MLERIKMTFYEGYSNDTLRRLLMFRLLNVVLCVVSFVMSVMNILTNEHILLYITSIYSLLCFLNFALAKKQYVGVKIAFFAETLVMLSIFIITGIPEGFSLLWTLLIPACAMSIFGRRSGSLLSAALFSIIVFFFWLPQGNALLHYNYSQTYVLRFPIIYICIYLISFYVEWIRWRTFQKLTELEHKNRWLYRHDALTGVYSRHAFYEEIGKVFAETSDSNEVAILMIDIDNFKRINDNYGHNVGDNVLCKISDIIKKNICEHCLTCRWGGEEFLIVMKCKHNPVHIAEKIRMDAEDATIILDNGTTVSFTISIGISLGDSTTKERLADYINQADRAMYVSKANGKNRITIADAEPVNSK